MSTNKWNPYVQLRGEETLSFFKTHFNNSNKKLLFILGKGFDVRMNIVIAKLLESCPAINIQCLLIEFNEGDSSHSHTYKPLVDENLTELTTLIGSSKIIRKSISLFNRDTKNKKRIGDRQAATIIKDFSELSAFTDVILDISALPRGVYSSLIGKILSILDGEENKTMPINFFTSVAENAEIDMKVQGYGSDNDLNYLFGFGGGIELSAENEKPIIWFPILGENKVEHFNKAFTYIISSQNRPYEICPILPFPAKNLRRVDSLIIEYHKVLFDKLLIESKNIMYVPEQNPFEAYLSLNNTIKNYNTSLGPLNGCKAVISNFSSKLLSIGTILTAHELQQEIGVGILNVDSEGYKINNIEEIKNLKSQSELFLSWLSGDPYND